MIDRRSLYAVAFSILVAFIIVQGGLGQCYSLPTPDENEERIFAQSACSGVSNDPPNPTIFTISEPRIITKIGTYHWNQASGETPGTISLKDKNGKVYGPWQADGEPGQGRSAQCLLDSKFVARSGPTPGDIYHFRLEPSYLVIHKRERRLRNSIGSSSQNWEQKRETSSLC